MNSRLARELEHHMAQVWSQEERDFAERLIHGLHYYGRRRAAERWCWATKTEHRYMTDPVYHAAVDTMAGVMVSGMLDETPLSDEAINHLMVDFRTVIGPEHLPESLRGLLQ